MTNVEILKATKELLSDPKRWTTGEYARDKDGKRVLPHEGGAVCFCLSGAVAKVLNRTPLDVGFHNVWSQLHAAMVPQAYRISDFNDSTDHPTLMATLDRAIASAEKVANNGN